MIFDPRPCELGEGPLWHPIREQLFWFDILNRTLHSQSGGEAESRSFPDIVSAAGWIDRDTLLIASEAGSNDGRADRQGGFWFGTMGRRAERGAGAIWRWYRGEVRKVFPGITIPNAISFTPDGRAAHFADTVTGRVMKVALDAQGWPSGSPEVWLDLSAEGLNPDGAVIDAAGRLWNAQWGAGRVAAYAPDGSFLTAVEVPDAPQTSCPAFGGPGLSTLYITTALEHMDEAARARHPNSGKVFAFDGIAKGLPEPQVIR
mgnify:FL=1